jgi:phospholipid-binding lipoprotein MlaA
MKRRDCGKTGLLGVLLALLLVFPVPAPAAEAEKPSVEAWDIGWEDDLLAGEEAAIADPLEPLNRFFYQFNDRLYYWFLKPVAANYAEVVPADIRTTIVNFFDNLLAPVRIANNLLQGKPRQTGIEVSRFLINSTVGIAGLADPARNEFGLEPQYEDLGQSLGYYGLGGGIYIVWPFLGPSNLRDTIGFWGDSYLRPLGYLARDEPTAALGVSVGNSINRASFRIGDYESFQESAFDPYVALRDAYQQHRKSMIEDRLEQTSQPFFTEHRPADRLERHAEPQPALAVPDGADRYFVQVGSFVDLEPAQRLQTELQALDEPSVVWTHERGDCRFYGVQVPAGTYFAGAKTEELRLASTGFTAAILVGR